ncbi:Cathepsin L-like proteinase [Halotydeus destructor]|nr:Cathepsin L-like proteinase [Halotydeus destructor]
MSNLAMKYLVVLALIGCALADTSANTHWQRFKAAFEREYTGGEEACRRAIFERNLATIVAHNLEADQGIVRSRTGVNRFTDMTTREIPRIRNRANPTGSSAANDALWQQLKTDFSKVYSAGEDKCRRAIFDDAVDLINSHNQRFNQGLESYSMGVNQFADMTSGEVPTGRLRSRSSGFR